MIQREPTIEELIEQRRADETELREVPESVLRPFALHQLVCIRHAESHRNRLRPLSEMIAENLVAAGITT
jgi:hypothetical protein